jgi:hypothetical protein
MTPLAQRVARDMLLPRKDRSFSGEAEEWVVKNIADAHFFDVAGVLPLAHELVRSCGGEAAALSDLAFLPAPVTWFEFRAADGGRAAFMIAQIAAGKAIVVVVTAEMAARPVGFIYTDIAADGAGLMPAGVMSGWPPDVAERMLMTVYGLLNLINRPGSLERREHAAHRGLARDMSRKALVGKFPLRGWTEITLCVGPGGNMREPKAAGGTGDKCLHFVRAHRRRCWGVWVQIPAHWKGDPALGIKQTRYSVVPPRKTA